MILLSANTVFVLLHFTIVSLGYNYNSSDDHYFQLSVLHWVTKSVKRKV